MVNFTIYYIKIISCIIIHVYSLFENKHYYYTFITKNLVFSLFSNKKRNNIFGMYQIQERLYHFSKLEVMLNVSTDYFMRLQLLLHNFHLKSHNFGNFLISYLKLLLIF